MSPHDNPISMEDLMKLAASPAGQQLMTVLRQSHPETMQQAMQKALSGDMEGAKNALSTFTQDPQIQKLLQQMGG